MFQCNVQILTWAFSNKSICRCKPLSSTATELLLLLPSASKTDVVGSANSKQQKKALYSLSLTLSLTLKRGKLVFSSHDSYVRQTKAAKWLANLKLSCAQHCSLSHTHTISVPPLYYFFPNMITIPFSLFIVLTCTPSRSSSYSKFNFSVRCNTFARALTTKGLLLSLSFSHTCTQTITPF